MVDVDYHIHPGTHPDLLSEALDWALRIRRLDVFVFCRELADIKDKYARPSMDLYPRRLCKYEDFGHRWRFYNGSVVQFCCCPAGQTPVGKPWEDVWNFAGCEMHLLLVDTPSEFTEFQLAYLKSRVRLPNYSAEVPFEYKEMIPGIIYG